MAYFKLSASEAPKESTKAQGPYLARIEFLWRLYNITKDASTLMAHFKEFFQAYIRMFASKPGFYFDLIYFKTLIAKLDLSEFVLNELKQSHDSNRPFKSVKSIYACLSYWQMHRFFGKQINLSNDDLVKLASDFEQMYKEALEFGKDLVSTSFQYADEFLILGVHLRYDLYKRDPQSQSILQLIVNLRHGLVYSPSNYQLKLLLLNLYSHLGAYDCLHAMYDSMEIKNIQNYSTANLLLLHNMRLGALGISYNTYMSMNQFFTSNLFDMANFLVYCFKYGTFLKALEIYSFMNTISQSLTLNLCLTNTAAVHFISHPLTSDSSQQQQNEENPEHEFKTLEARLDNHLREVSNVSSVFDTNGLLPDDNAKLNEVLMDQTDKNILYQWEPEEQDQLAQDQYKLVLDEQRRLLKLRNIMIRLSDTAFKLWFSDSATSSDLIKKYNLYKTKLNEFNFEPLIKNEQEFDAKLKIYVTKSNYLARWSQLDLNKILNLVVNLSSDLCLNETYLEQEQQNEQKTLIAYRDQLKQLSESVQTKLNSLVTDLKNEFKIEKISQVLESMTASLEALSYASVLLTACLSTPKLKPIWSEKMKKSKKKKGAYAQYAQSVDLVYEVFEHLTSLVAFYPSQLKQNLCPNVAKWTQAQCASVQSTVQLNYTPNLSDISQAYSKSFDELRSNFSAQLKYLSKFAGNSAILNQIMENLKLIN